ncbi:hypothetical protein T4B_1479 [Trichinella pseudospiralis]|uniref:Uncharacterized protein n=1 Tax=Trichinella pseudospiralis TaxID=6337 RepID=A0A0V1IQ84_TRIPS|nr:hypothetical protein T4E_8345 [Trichinella pseudospiralis]KRY68393.1 hypothetical protein T4A_2387 [Trichinella pseudospiralis]KRZ08634.1 hypothetical protein T4B_1479 [Trichinella pseudospiralis]KRZ24759.1 hypothetical protein T4C_3262 [Trichinella pseudospiralis]KRZ35401.1 hypothetical protein T4C_13981 [Trichinella pseudospiralis]
METFGFCVGKSVVALGITLHICLSDLIDTTDDTVIRISDKMAQQKLLQAPTLTMDLVKQDCCCGSDGLQLIAAKHIANEEPLVKRESLSSNHAN